MGFWTFIFVFFANWPPFYVATFFSADDIDTVQEAQFAIAQLNDVLKKLADDTSAYIFYGFLLFFVLAAHVIPSLYNFSVALVPGERIYDDIEDDKIISIFEKDKNYGK